MPGFWYILGGHRPGKRFKHNIAVQLGILISGVPDGRWDNDVLHELHQVQGADFEAVDVSSLMVDPDSGQARSP